MNILQWLQAAGSIVTLIVVIFIIYKTFSDPDIKAANKIDLLTQGCDLKHKALDSLWGEKFTNIENNIVEINKSFAFLQENDLKHVEESVKALELGQERIVTMLNERLPRKE